MDWSDTWKCWGGKSILGYEMSRDKLIERDRYDAHARAQLADITDGMRKAALGSAAIKPSLRTPYLVYEQRIRDLVHSEDRVLELAAGSGMHTQILLLTGAHVTATDISPESLKLLEQRVRADFGALTTQIADMEALPFPDGVFDVVTCAGGLSYGAPIVVDAEIRRVLRPGGTLICVDSLNHNFIYRLNRWLHYLRGERTKSTLLRMPDLSRIARISQGYSEVDIQYFGAFSFAAPIIVQLFEEPRAQRILDRLDWLVNVKWSAFKFVMSARGLN